MYYNTNKESGETLLKSRDKARSQEKEIVRILEKWIKNGRGWSVAPHELLLYFDNVPLTSIRRAITNLEKDGKLEKTDRMVKGTYGKMVHTWKLKNVAN